MKLRYLLIGPGIMSIPPRGWGAVETVIWELSNSLQQNGHTTHILNKRGLINALKAKPWTYDIVHLHYDELALLWWVLSQVFRFKLVVTTHYGYAAYPQRWDSYYKNIFFFLRLIQNHFVLSGQIKTTFIQKGLKGNIHVIPNGTVSDNIHFQQQGNGKVLYLGKIEPRKQQTNVIKSLKKQGFSGKIDFVGPVVDRSFSIEIDNFHYSYLGVWTRNEVKSKLGQYSCLLLLSDGEAHPLVVLEAMSAGLSVILSSESAANLDLAKPWIKIVKQNQNLKSIIESAINSNNSYRDRIRQYCRQHFDWHNIVQLYEKETKKLIKE